MIYPMSRIPRRPLRNFATSTRNHWTSGSTNGCARSTTCRSPRSIATSFVAVVRPSRVSPSSEPVSSAHSRPLGKGLLPPLDRRTHRNHLPMAGWGHREPRSKGPARREFLRMPPHPFSGHASRRHHAPPRPSRSCLPSAWALQGFRLAPNSACLI